MSELNLSLYASATDLFNTVKEIYPQLSDEEADKLSGYIITEITRRLREGEQIAFFYEDSDGNKKLSLLALEIISNSPFHNKIGG